LSYDVGSFGMLLVSTYHLFSHNVTKLYAFTYMHKIFT